MSDGFKFGDLIKPGEGAKLVLESELKRRRDAWNRPGYHYRGVGDFLLREGRYYGPPIVFPDDSWFQGRGGMGGPYGTCFINAVEYAEQFGVRYCEGLYTTQGSVVAHAWCLTPDDRPIEVTHPNYDELQAQGINVHTPEGTTAISVERWAYWGAVFTPEFVRWHAENPGLDTDKGLPTYCIFDRGPHEVAERRLLGLGDEDGFRDVHDAPVLKVPFDPKRTSL